MSAVDEAPVPLLQVQGLSKRYGSTTALAGVDLAARDRVRSTFTLDGLRDALEGLGGTS